MCGVATELAKTNEYDYLPSVFGGHSEVLCIIIISFEEVHLNLFILQQTKIWFH